MNRRNFLETATKSMACAGTAMLLTGRSLQQTELEKPDERWFGEGEYEVWIWRMTSKYSAHTWCEFRDSIEFPQGRVYTRPMGAKGAFKQTTVTPYCYPLVDEKKDPKKWA